MKFSSITCGGMFMTIKQNKKHTVFSFILLFIVAVGMLCFVIFDMRKLPHDYNVVLDNVVVFWIVKILVFVCAFFVAVGDIYLFKQLFSEEPLIVICDEYFYDNSSAISLGKIAWTDMKKVYMKGGFLNIKLKKTDGYLENKNWLQMLMIKSNYWLGYGDVCIGAERFKKESKTFLDEFTKRRGIDAKF